MAIIEKRKLVRNSIEIMFDLVELENLIALKSGQALATVKDADKFDKIEIKFVVKDGEVKGAVYTQSLTDLKSSWPEALELPDNRSYGSR